MCTKKAKNTNPLREVYENSGREYDYTNRVRAVKSLNELINSGTIKLELVEKGYVKTSSNGKDWNLTIEGFGNRRGFHIKGGDITPLEILTCVGKFFRYDSIRALINATVSDNINCSKCSGRGVIPQFGYYANGVCFDCLGSGMVRNPNIKIEIK